jgi:hypothetical protein
LGRIRIPDTIPIAAKQDIIDEPPALKNGRVRPITGVSPRHIPMFSKVWKVSMAEKPTQMSIFI